MEQKTDVRDPDEKVVEIEMERLRAFPNHPFKVIGDSQMIELQDSIKKYGVLNPLIVRPKIEGYYEIISGHRRKYAAEKLGYKKIPIIIRVLQDDEAVVIMVDSNFPYFEANLESLRFSPHRVPTDQLEEIRRFQPSLPPPRSNADCGFR